MHRHKRPVRARARKRKRVTRECISFSSSFHALTRCLRRALLRSFVMQAWGEQQGAAGKVLMARTHTRTHTRMRNYTHAESHAFNSLFVIRALTRVLFLPPLWRCVCAAV